MVLRDSDVVLSEILDKLEGLSKAAVDECAALAAEYRSAARVRAQAAADAAMQELLVRVWRAARLRPAPLPCLPDTLSARPATALRLSLSSNRCAWASRRLQRRGKLRRRLRPAKRPRSVPAERPLPKLLLPLLRLRPQLSHLPLGCLSQKCRSVLRPAARQRELRCRRRTQPAVVKQVRAATRQQRSVGSSSSSSSSRRLHGRCAPSPRSVLRARVMEFVTWSRGCAAAQTKTWTLSGTVSTCGLQRRR